MKNTSKTLCRVALLALALQPMTAAFADKPGHNKHQQRGEHGESGEHGRRDYGDRDDGDRGYQDRREQPSYYQPYFNNQHRSIVRDYYASEYQTGRCPPGLAKKHNGCMPPGQAKRWAIGHRLPRDVVYYELPPYMVRQLGYPPAGYRYVRVASDILMIAVGTGLVMEAISDLNLR